MGKFTDEQKRIAWNNASPPPLGMDKIQYRLDYCGALMYWPSYGKDTAMGWEVDHIFPAEKGGKEDPINLRAMQHQNNASKGQDYPEFSCKVKYIGKVNSPLGATFRTVHENRRANLAKLYGKKAL